MKSLMRPHGSRAAGSNTSPARGSNVKPAASPGDLLNSKIPELNGEFSKLTAPGIAPLYAAAGAEADTAATSNYTPHSSPQLDFQGDP